MKTLVIYYSYTGSTKRLAKQTAEKEHADICEIVEKRKPGIIKAYTIGCISSIKGKRSVVEPISADMSSYEKIIIISPVWAGNPTPAVNNIFQILPSGKGVEIIMVSASGKSSCKDKLGQLIENKGSQLIRFTDIKKLS